MRETMHADSDIVVLFECTTARKSKDLFVAPAPILSVLSVICVVNVSDVVPVVRTN